MIRYRVIKPGLMSEGWVGEYLAHVNGKIALKFANGRELHYRGASVQRLNEGAGGNAEEGQWIVIKENANSGQRPETYKHHETEESARKEAIRLAQAMPGHAFRYYKQCGCVEYKAVTSYELKETK